MLSDCRDSHSTNIRSIKTLSILPATLLRLSNRFIRSVTGFGVGAMANLSKNFQQKASIITKSVVGAVAGGLLGFGVATSMVTSDEPAIEGSQSSVTTGSVSTDVREKSYTDLPKLQLASR